MCVSSRSTKTVRLVLLPSWGAPSLTMTVVIGEGPTIAETMTGVIGAGMMMR